AEARSAELVEADRRKTEFLAMLAHELRNPLAPIHNAIEILQRSGGDEQAVTLATDVLERQAAHMVHLVDQLLDVSRISRGRIDLRKEPIDLAALVRQAVESARPSCERMHQELTVRLPPEPTLLNADPDRLTQVVGNLLNNACKFTASGGRIQLTLEHEAGE